MKYSTFKKTILGIFLLVALTPQASAYLDPGTGAMILQFLLAALVGVLLYVKAFFGRIKVFFNRNPKKEAG